MLMPGVAPVEKEALGNIGKSPVMGISAAAPGIVTEFFNRRAFVVGNGLKTALVVFVDVVHGLIAFFVEGVNGKQTIAAA